MSSWSEERRLDKAADAIQRREDKESASKLRRDEERQTREDKRAEKGRNRRDKLQRRQARAARREKLLRPGSVYRRGTLLLISLSAAASLPAQVMHFVAISWMLFPIGPAVEGAAWVMAAGVAYADEMKLAPWVRWLLRILSLSAAVFAANINYQYGLSLAGQGLTAGQAQTAGLGLAAVTIGGPLFFEVRQWVLTMTASVLSPKQQAAEKARRKHDKKRRKAFKDVVDRQKELLLAAPFGTLAEEDAFDQAWQQLRGARRGVRADWYADQLDAEAEMELVLEDRGHRRERLAVDTLLAEVFPPEGGDGGPSGTVGSKPTGGPHGGAPKGRTALGGKGKRPVRSTPDTAPLKPLAEADLQTVRKLAEALGDTDRLSARNIREAVGCRTDYAVRLRDAIRSEGEQK